MQRRRRREEGERRRLEKISKDLEGIITCAQYLESFFLDDYEATRKDSTAKSIAVQIIEDLRAIRAEITGEILDSPLEEQKLLSQCVEDTKDS